MEKRNLHPQLWPKGEEVVLKNGYITHSVNHEKEVGKKGGKKNIKNSPKILGTSSTMI